MRKALLVLSLIYSDLVVRGGGDDGYGEGKAEGYDSAGYYCSFKNKNKFVLLFFFPFIFNTVNRILCALTIMNVEDT